MPLPGWLQTQDDQGRLRFVSLTGSGATVIVNADADLARQLLGALDGTSGVEETLAAFEAGQRQIAEALLHRFVEVGILGFADEEYATAPERDRYLRQLEYFEDLTRDQRLALKAQRRLASASFAVVGVGGVGTWTVLNLAMAGARRFILVDPDRVELSNLSRQLLFAPSDVGAPKVEAAARWLRHFDTDIDVLPVVGAIHNSADLDDIGVVPDVIIRTAGYVPSPMGRELNRYALRSGSMSLSIGGASWGPLVGGDRRSDTDGCLGCFETVLQGSGKTFGALANHRRQVRETHSPVFGPSLAATASLAVRDLLLDLAGISHSEVRGGVKLFDRGFTQLRWIDVRRHDDCPDCGDGGKRLDGRQ